MNDKDLPPMPSETAHQYIFEMIRELAILAERAHDKALAQKLRQLIDQEGRPH